MFKTKVEIPKSQLVDYQSNYLFLGSCFSEHLSQRMIQSGFNIHTNPFGVVFNPISLAELLLESDEYLKNSVFDRDGVALSWLANSTCFAYNPDELKNKLVELRKDYLTALSTAKILFVTLGTAWVYYKKTIDHIVGNCHKAAKNDFEKRLLTIEEIVSKWTEVIEKIQSESDVKIIFTVSPVRHTKDGVIENSRSKAVLLSAVHHLNDQYANVGYFPAYELMMDEMRDYAFYTKDGVHPNDIAIDEIWNRFKTTYFTAETEKICQEYEKIKMLFEHRSLHPESEAAKQFEVARERKLDEFKKKYPGFNHKKH
ncbi:MAG TPA: GSCFA domain-containing protein [Brumimicrobium sp.]|nr:GSCFA domain-containing protein [Brumimicrobium sp.]